ncbi:MAG: SDR family oxidoreductase [Sandaracinaceae bacterium]
MTHVVVTGGTRGFGFGLVEAFVARGCRVTLCGRSERSVQAALSRLPAGVCGVVADVQRYADVVQLYDAAVAEHGPVDLFINNAGTSNAQQDFVDLTPESIDRVVGVNLLGTMHGCRVALERMREAGRGHVFLMEGFGSDGRVQPGMAPYGATKRAIRYLTRALVRETKGGPVKVSRLSPGIVVTDLLLDVYRHGDPANFARQRWLFEVIADPVEPVARWMADRILAGPRHGAFVAWMTVPKAALRFLQPRYHRRRLFAALEV